MNFEMKLLITTRIETMTKRIIRKEVIVVHVKVVVVRDARGVVKTIKVNKKVARVTKVRQSNHQHHPFLRWEKALKRKKKRVTQKRQPMITNGVEKID